MNILSVIIINEGIDCYVIQKESSYNYFINNKYVLARNVYASLNFILSKPSKQFRFANSLAVSLGILKLSFTYLFVLSRHSLFSKVEGVLGALYLC